MVMIIDGLDMSRLTVGQIMGSVILDSFAAKKKGSTTLPSIKRLFDNGFTDGT